MLNEREVRYRMKCAEDQGVPITNYGTAIAFMNGILKRKLICSWRQFWVVKSFVEKDIHRRTEFNICPLFIT